MMPTRGEVVTKNFGFGVKMLLGGNANLVSRRFPKNPVSLYLGPEKRTRPKTCFSGYRNLAHKPIFLSADSDSS